MTRTCILLSILLLASSSGVAQTPQLVKDINTIQAGSEPANFTELGSKVLFWANEGNLGREPYIYDPSTGVTSILMDIYPGSEGSDINASLEKSLISLNGFIYFSALHPDYGEELWRTNGTITELVHDINPGSIGSSPDYLTAYDNGSEVKVFFAATIGSEREIHILDDQGDYESSINIDGTNSSDPKEFTLFQNKLYFSATEATTGRELWSTDGKPANTKLEEDVYEFGTSGDPTHLIALDDNLLLFSAELENKGRELCGYDGTNLETEDIFSGSDSSNPEDFIRVDNQTYFTATDNGDRNYYRLNGSNVNPILMTNLSGYNFFRKIDDAVSFNSKLYYLFDGDLFELSATSDIQINIVRRGQEMKILNNKLFIIGKVPFLSDGTTGGTTALAPITNQFGFNGETINLSVIDGIAYFSGDGPMGSEVYINSEIVVSDLLEDINIKTLGINPDEIGVGDDHVLFDLNGITLWSSDGTSNNTLPILNHPDTTYDLQSRFFRIDNELYFSMNRNVAPEAISFMSTDIYKYNLANSTFSIADQSESLSFSSSFQSRLEEFYFSRGNDLYLYSKTEGIELLNNEFFSNFIHWNDDNYYIRATFPSGLYKNDELLISISSVFQKIKNLTPTKELLFFTFDSSPFGRELWKTDGTPAGTEIVTDINPGINLGSDPKELVTINNILYFVANDGTGDKIWKTDGTAANTSIVTSFNVSPQNLTAYNGDLYFSGQGQGGRSLYKTVAASGETQELKSINGGGDSDPQDFYVHNNILYFTADDGINGRELWKTDGTTLGTSLVSDINPGMASSSPSNLTSIEGKLIFMADHPTAGRELFALSTCPTSMSLACDNGPCEIHSDRLDAAGALEISNHKTLTDKALRISAGGGLTIDGEIEVITTSLLEVYVDGCN